MFFGSPLAALRPFDSADGGYVELLASIIKLRLEDRERESEMRFAAQHDDLTGLLNRHELSKRARLMLDAARDSEAQVAFVMLDVDNLTDVNDTMGHGVGDYVLKTLSQRLSDAVRGRDIVARFAGDTFAVALANTERSREVEALVRRLQRELEKPIPYDGRELRVKVSCGIALYPSDADTVDELINNASVAMHHVKRSDPGNYRFFGADIERELQHRRLLMRDLDRALAADEFELYVQPQTETVSGKLIGGEALVRWNHPARGLISPAEFIPFAEENGLIESIGAVVVRKGILLAMMCSEIWPDFRLSINLSAHELHDPGFVLKLAHELRVAKLQGRNFGLEITESAAMRAPDMTRRILERFNEMGIAVSLDDFGTGYSSLAYLKNYPIDVIKIDQSFIAGIPHDPHDVGIVRAVIAFARTLERTVLAEGVETEAQLAWLRANGCDQVQGNIIAGAMPASDFVAWAQDRQKVARPAAF